jgi:hypothetical protein
MKKIILLSALMASVASPAFSQAAAKPGNCAVVLEEAAKTVDADARFDGQLEKDAIKAFETFAKAQRKIVKDGMAKTYADSKAFGWDKAKVDQMMTMNEDAVRKGFKTSTMEDGTLYMNHIIAVNNCAEAKKQDAQFGQSRDGFVATLTEVFNRLQMG